MTCEIKLWFWVPIVIGVILLAMSILATKRYSTKKPYPKFVDIDVFQGFIPNLGTGIALSGILGGGFLKLSDAGILADTAEADLLSAMLVLSFGSILFTCIVQGTVRSKPKSTDRHKVKLDGGWPYWMNATAFRWALIVVLLAAIITFRKIN